MSETIDKIVQPQPSESSEMENLRIVLEQTFSEGYTPCLIGPDGTQIEIPDSAFEALKAVVRGMAAGKTITVIPSNRQLTTQQAAEMLNVSRPHVIKLLDQGEIPFTKTGTHRRIEVSDVLAYREARARRRREQLREITRMSTESRGGYS